MKHANMATVALNAKAMRSMEKPFLRERCK
jgi:hypothetical protein